jgi:hypothetical protein
MGELSHHGIETPPLFVRGSMLAEKCYPCRRTKLLPMSPD